MTNLETDISEYQKIAIQLTHEIAGEQNEAVIALLDRALIATRNRIAAAKPEDEAQIWLQIRFFLDEAARWIEPNSDMETARQLINQHFAQHTIDHLNSRVSLIGSDFRYRKTSDGNTRFYDVDRTVIIGKHVGEVIGEDRFEHRARGFLEQAFSGRRCDYYHLLESADGERVMKCIMEPGRSEERSALVTMVDVTDCIKTTAPLELVSLKKVA